MPLTTSPFVMKDVTLTLVKSGGGTPVEMRCQLSQAEIVPGGSTGGGTDLSYSTFCDDFSTTSSSGKTYALTLSGFQALADATDFARLAWEEEDEIFDFVLTPMGGTVSATNPAFEGQVTMQATNIGGTAGQYATFQSVALPCVTKPTMVLA